MMNKNVTNILIGLISSIIVVGLVIFTFETGRSFVQSFFAFVLFIIPFSFISSFNSKLGSFLLMSFIIIFLYASYKLSFKDVWIGIVQAFILGGALYIFRIRKAKVFSKRDYTEKLKINNENKC